MKRLTTKAQADAEAIAHFEADFQRCRRANIDEIRDMALAGDRWSLAMLHLRSMDGDELAKAAIAESAYLTEELRRHVY